jgi:hypothetical protein
MKSRLGRSGSGGFIVGCQVLRSDEMGLAGERRVVVPATFTVGLSDASSARLGRR